jgi:hypothetical protein
VVRKSKTKEDIQKNESAVWWKLYEWKESVPVGKKISRRLTPSAPSARKLMLTLFWHMNAPILEHYQEKGQSTVWSTAPCWKRNWSLQFAVIADFCPKASSFSMTMCDHTLLLQQLPPSRNWNLGPQIIPLTVQTPLLPTIMCFARLRKHCEDEDFTVTTRWRRWYISGFDNKQNGFFYWNTEASQKMWKVHCKRQWWRRKITSYLDLYIWCASQYNAICPYFIVFKHPVASIYHLNTI